VPNFVVAPIASTEPTALPGTPGKRIVCVANLRPEKDHPNLIAAMKVVVQSEPSASLLLLGSESDPVQVAKVKECILNHALANNVFLLGCRTDVSSVLRGCNVGVLSSASEGMPLALLEYGVAGLPVVATRVGQVPAMLDEGRAGLLVPPGDAGALATDLLALMKSAELREKLGRALRLRVADNYSEASAMRHIVRIYETVLGIGTAFPAFSK
jgi:glycosyltransferase involved in cell wall biosynthesis